MTKEWTVFLDRCLAQRIQADLFVAAVAQLHSKSPLPGQKLATLLLRPRSPGLGSIDPRIIVYLEQHLALRRVDACDVLSSTFLYSKDRLPKTGDTTTKDAQWNNPPELEEIVFHRLHKSFAAEERPLNSTEGIRTIIVVTRWMQAMVTSHTNDTMIQAMAGIQQQPQQQSINVREGLGMLIVGIIENSKILQILNNPKGKGTIFASLQTTLSSCYDVSLDVYTRTLLTGTQIYARTSHSHYHHSFHSYHTTPLDHKHLSSLPTGWKSRKNSMNSTRNSQR